MNFDYTSSYTLNNAPNLIILDTEFTSLGEKGTPQLLSLGCTTLSNAHEAYWELDDWRPELVSDFTRREVLPLMWRGTYRVNVRKLAPLFKAHIESLGPDVMLAVDSPWDWFWVKTLCSGQQTLNAKLEDDDPMPFWPKNLRRQWFPLNFSDLPNQEQLVAHMIKTNFFNQYIPHHALIDARCLRLMLVEVLKEAQITEFKDAEQLFVKKRTYSIQSAFMGIK